MSNMIVSGKRIVKVMSRHLQSIGRQMQSIGKQKIFCVGRNKTGTTSLTLAMKELGYVVGDQRTAEFQVKNWGQRDFTGLKRYCRSGEFFQDTPFSLPYTFQAMDMYFPGSKFILTIRDAEAWHKSMLEFHSKPDVHGAKSKSLELLKEAEYCYKGFAYDTKALVYDLPGDDPYDKETLISHFHFHNRMVMDYFRNRKDDLLVLNVSDPGAYRELCQFLDKPCQADAFPWENKT